MEQLSTYLARIGYTGAPAPTLATLVGVHEAHALAVPFENLDIQLGRRVTIDVEQLVDKIVVRRRGGYCFEQNTLFGAALEALGFGVTRLLARVHTGAPPPTPRTHMVLEVAIGGEIYLADVGFGADGLYRPIPLVPGEHLSGGDRYRLSVADGKHTLSLWRAGEWRDEYTFTREPQFAVDFEVANWFTSTHPASKFVQTLTAQKLEPARRWRLRDRDLILIEGGVETRSRVDSPDELLEILRRTFGLEFPAGTRFLHPVF